MIRCYKQTENTEVINRETPLKAGQDWGDILQSGQTPDNQVHEQVTPSLETQAVLSEPPTESCQFLPVRIDY